MEPKYNPQKRLIVPLWRDVIFSGKNRELDNQDPQIIIPPSKQAIASLKDLVISWEKNRTIPNAADLIDSAYSIGMHSEFAGVIEFILKTQKDHNTSLYQFARKLDDEVHNVIIDPITLIEFNNELHYRNKIKYLKTILYSNPNNPIDWIEMARNYTVLGQFEKAEDCIKSALQLAPKNRFVLRSSASFYFHNHKNKDNNSNEIEKAYFYIRKSPNVKNDPWLLSIEISLSHKMGKTSSLMNVGQKLLDSNLFNNYSTSELASALATVFHNNGEFKKARSLFRLSLIDPFENSVTQAISLLGNNFIDQSNKNLCTDLLFPYEARSLKLYFQGSYKEAIEESYKWLGDQPFSIRPIDFGSSISSTFLQDYEKSISLIKFGLKHAQDNPHLINNLIFAYIMNGDINSAEKLFKKLKFDPDKSTNFNLKTKICLTATLGLYFFRKGDTESGRTFYLQAIDKSKLLKEDSLTALAVVNYAREEVLADEVDNNMITSLLDRYCKDRKEPEVIVLYNRIKELIREKGK